MQFLDYDRFYGSLYFEPGSDKKCFQFNITDDDIAGEENLEYFLVDWYIPPGDIDVAFYHSYEDSSAFSVVPIEDNDGKYIMRVESIEDNDGQYVMRVESIEDNDGQYIMRVESIKAIPNYSHYKNKVC